MAKKRSRKRRQLGIAPDRPAGAAEKSWMWAAVIVSGVALWTAWRR